MEANKYTLVVKRKRIPVSKEVYKEYYRYRDREKYVASLEQENNISLDGCAEKGKQVEYVYASSRKSLEDEIIHKETISKMLKGLDLLESDERDLIIELFFNDKSERALSAETGIPQKTINDRKHVILNKLKKIIEN